MHPHQRAVACLLFTGDAACQHTLLSPLTIQTTCQFLPAGQADCFPNSADGDLSRTTA